MTQEKITLIALPTAQTPDLTDGANTLVAVTALTRARAAEILAQMKSVTELAERWVGVYKLSCFDGNTFYVPAKNLETLPSPTDFRVLSPNFTTPVVAQVIRTQIGVIPGAAIWEAFDVENHFMISTIELSAELLEAIAAGVTFNPGDTSEALKHILPAQPINDETPGWSEHVM